MKLSDYREYFVTKKDIQTVKSFALTDGPYGHLGRAGALTVAGLMNTGKKSDEKKAFELAKAFLDVLKEAKK